MKRTQVPRVAPLRAARRVSSVVILNTGDGKGKSTAAFGTMLRAVARGWKVGVVQFVKGDRWKVGEREIADRLGVDWQTIGDGFTWDSHDLERSEAVAREAWHAARELIAADSHQLVILDEITYPINWGWIAIADVVSAIRARPAAVNVILTGRDAPDELIELADTVTEMRNRKHAFEAGVKAMRGIDF